MSTVFSGKSQAQQELYLQHGGNGLAVLNLPTQALVHQLIKATEPNGQKIFIERVRIDEGQTQGQIQQQPGEAMICPRGCQSAAVAPTSSFSSRRAVVNGSSPGSRFPAGISSSVLEKA